MAATHDHADRMRFTADMAGLVEVFARLADDVAFADQLRTNPARALRGYDLTADELARLSRALESNAPMVPSLFEPPAD